MKAIFDHASNALFFILIISSASSTSSNFLNYLVVLTKLSKKISLVKLFTVLFSCLNLSMYSTNTSFSCCLAFIIIARYCVNEIYGYVACIGLYFDWEIASVSFKGWLIILSYSGCYLILFWIWLGQKFLNIIAYVFYVIFQFVLYFHVILNLYFPYLFEGLIFRFRPDRSIFCQYPFNWYLLA